MINKVIAEGYMAKDPEVRRTETNVVCKFTIAVQYGWGEKKKTFFIPCATFSKTAEFMEKYLHKGDLISIEGRLSQSFWQDATTGKERSAIEIVCDNVYILKSKTPNVNVKEEEPMIPFDATNPF
jgi:single-strand DNA-binding protein